jgi:CheY-like chemotaxis protein
MRMLIVDDEPSVTELFIQAAKSRGIEEIETANNGEEALSRVIGATYDLITLDIRMPGVSGLDVLAPIRNMCPHAIIAIISGHVPDNFTTEMAGCADLVMRKPIFLDNFLKLIDGAVRIAGAMDDIRELNEVDA